MTTETISFKSRLQMEVDFFKSCNLGHTSKHKYFNIADFVVQHGIEMPYSPLPKDVKKRQKRECFYNAFKLASSRPKDFVYCEGYALSFIHVHHAWVVDRHTGHVVDCTWDDDENHLYVGVPFLLPYVKQTVKKIYGDSQNGYYQLYSLLDRWEENFPLLNSDNLNEAIDYDFLEQIKIFNE